MIEMTLGELRQLESLGERVRKLANKKIKQKREAFYLFDALDEIPDGWPSESLGEGCGDYYCLPCARKVLKAGKKYLPADYDGPSCCQDEGEFSRNCCQCGRPLPWSLLKYGMESEIEWYESDEFFKRRDNCEVSENDWYWLWKVIEECLGCEEYLNEYGQDVRELLVNLFLKTASNRTVKNEVDNAKSNR